MKGILKFIIIVTTKNEINEIPPKIIYALGIQAEFSFFRKEAKWNQYNDQNCTSIYTISCNNNGTFLYSKGI